MKNFFSLPNFTFTEILLWCILFFAQALIGKGSYLEYLYNNFKSFISLLAIASPLFIILNFVLIKFYNSKSLELSEVYIYSFSIGTLLLNLIIVFIVKRIQLFNENSDIQSLSSTSKELILKRNMKIHYEELMLQEAKMIQINEELVGTLKDLEEKNFELDQFVYKTSHDLRSPLTTVLGLINLMKEESNNVTNIYLFQPHRRQSIKAGQFY